MEDGTRNILVRLFVHLKIRRLYRSGMRPEGVILLVFLFFCYWNLHHGSIACSTKTLAPLHRLKRQHLGREGGREGGTDINLFPTPYTNRVVDTILRQGST